MGYMGLDSVTDSDAAADFVCSLSDLVLKSIKKEMKRTYSQYNTDGIVNVALFLNEIRGTYMFGGLEDFINNYFLPKFSKYIDDIKESDIEEWNSSDAKTWHIRKYKKLYKNIADAIW